jgi:hypothetical protein
MQPVSEPAASLMRMRDVMFMALTRVNALFIIYHSHAPDGRGHWGNRPRPEQPQLNPTSTAEKRILLRLCSPMYEGNEQDSFINFSPL